MRNTWKKRCAMVMAVVSVVGALAGCSKAGGGNGSESSSGDGGPVKLTFKTLAWIKAEQEEQKAVIEDWGCAGYFPLFTADHIRLERPGLSG